jgi:hypothetical protein
LDTWLNGICKSICAVHPYEDKEGGDKIEEDECASCDDE